MAIFLAGRIWVLVLAAELRAGGLDPSNHLEVGLSSSPGKKIRMAADLWTKEARPVRWSGAGGPGRRVVVPDRRWATGWPFFRWRKYIFFQNEGYGQIKNQRSGPRSTNQKGEWRQVFVCVCRTCNRPVRRDPRGEKGRQLFFLNKWS